MLTEGGRALGSAPLCVMFLPLLGFVGHDIAGGSVVFCSRLMALHVSAAPVG